MKKKNFYFLLLGIFGLFYISIQDANASRGRWHVDLDQSPTGIVYALFTCEYSFFIKECTTGEFFRVINQIEN